MAADDAAVAVTLRADLKDYEAALKAALRVTENTASRAEQLLANIGKARPPGRAVAEGCRASTGQMANDARVLQSQLNDILSGLASGQGIGAVQVQLGQISQILSGAGGGGLRAGASLVGTALLGMINPINLAIVAFGVLSGVAASYFGDNKKAAEEANKALKEHRDAVQAAIEVWGKNAPEQARTYVQALKDIDAAQKEVEARNLLVAYAFDGANQSLGTLTDSLDRARSILSGFLDPSQLGTFDDAYATLVRNVENHTASVEDAERVYRLLKESGVPAVEDIADRFLRTLTPAIAEAVRQVNNLDASIKNAHDTVTQVYTQLGQLGPLTSAGGQFQFPATDLQNWNDQGA